MRIEIRVLCGLLLLGLLLTTAYRCSGQAEQSDKAQPTSVFPIGLRLLDIANQTQEDIEMIVGKVSPYTRQHSAFAFCTTCQKYTYLDGFVEIVYINDMADWIAVYPTDSLTATAVLPFLGLSQAAPHHSTPDVIIWKDLAGLHEIRAYRSKQQQITSVVIKVLTP
jgi:hypothetical protein